MTMAKGIMIVDGQRVPFDGEKNVLSVIRKAGIDMPTFCYYSELSVHGACRMCIVEDVKTGKIDASCSMEPRDGMEIRTNTARLLRHRRMILELLLAAHDCSCTTCAKSGNCRLQELAQRFGVRHNRFPNNKPRYEKDYTSYAVFRDPNKCILCGDCVRVCEELQGQGILNYAHRGSELQVMPAFDKKLDQTKCVGCGQCAAVCTTGAITVKNQIGQAWQALHDPKNRVVVQIAPAVRVALGEEFGLPAGENVMDRLVKALKLMGVEEVYDTDFAADMTIVEEANELVERIKNGGKLPMITSCSPGWVKFCEYYFPDMVENLSSCKSPQQMFGALVKTYYAEKMGIDPKDLFVVSIMPCTAKKFECTRDNEAAAGVPDVDISLTTRELANMIKRSGIRFTDLPDEDFDPMLGVASGAGHIFGATGGVMEAALRTVAEIVTGKALDNLDFTAVRGVEGCKEAEYDLAGTKVRVAVTSGTENAFQLLEMVRKGEADYHFIEVMACPGGCVNGGGQPHQPGEVRNFHDLRAERAAGLYGQDKNMKLRKSHENPFIKELYDTYLEKPGSHKAHHILHTTYVKRKVY